MTAARAPADRLLAPARLIMAVFFIQGALVANWFPRIPDVQAKLGLGPAALAIGLVGMPIGQFIALTFAGRVVENLTPRRTIMLGSGIYCAAMSLPGWASDIAGLFLGLMLLGGVFATVDVAINVTAAGVQRQLGRRIMSTCHGFWSLGAMAGAIIGAGFAEFAIATDRHLLMVGLIALAPAVALARALPPLRPEAIAAAGRQPVLSLPSRAMIGLAVFAFGVILAELATRTWAAVFMREAIGASPAATGLGYGAFSLAMATGRFLGDRGTERLGPVALARGCCIAAIVGAIAVATAPTSAIAILGLAVLGVGVSVGYPLAVTATAERDDRPAATNVAALALAAFSSSLVGPPLVGFVAEVAGLRAGLATMLPFVVASALLSAQLRRRETGSTLPTPAAR
jgi:MFS family permease